MSGFVNFLQDMVDEKIIDIYQGVIAKIEIFDKSTMRADVEILLRDVNPNNEKEYNIGLLQDIPVGYINGGGGYYIRPFYQKEDLVWISFSSFEMGKPRKGEKGLIDDGNAFDISNAIVSHGILKENAIPPVPFTRDGLIIGFGDNTFINIKENTLFMQTPGGNYELDATGKHSWNNGEVTLDP